MGGSRRKVNLATDIIVQARMAVKSWGQECDNKTIGEPLAQGVPGPPVQPTLVTHCTRVPLSHQVVMLPFNSMTRLLLTFPVSPRAARIENLKSFLKNRWLTLIWACERWTEDTQCNYYFYCFRNLTSVQWMSVWDCHLLKFKLDTINRRYELTWVKGDSGSWHMLLLSAKCIVNL